MNDYIQKQFVPVEIAEQLKEIGFDELCMAGFNPGLHGHFHYNAKNWGYANSELTDI